jgi:KaiC/GvpD/RAD55 family RecA-like ATPase
MLSGGAGAGKILLGIDFLVKGALLHNEPGVFLSFEESAEELYVDVAALNLDLKKLVLQKKIVVEHVVLERRDVCGRDHRSTHSLPPSLSRRRRPTRGYRCTSSFHCCLFKQ